MTFFKVIIFLLITILSFNNSFAEDHTTEQDIIEKAKEINQKIKKQQADKSEIITKETAEEPLPLNDPFVGDASLGGGATTATIVSDNDEDRSELSLYNFKLVGIVTGEYESYVSLINSSGEIVTLQMNEELSPGVKLIALKPDEAIFEKDSESYLKINFKNQIKETSDIF